MSDVRVQMVTAALPNTTGTFDVTIPGFGTPKAMLCLSAIAPADNVVSNWPHVSVGACDGVNQFAVGQVTQHNATQADAASVTKTNAVIHAINYVALATTLSWEFVQWITDGVRINCTVAGGPAGNLVHFVFFAGSDIDVTCGYQDYGVNDYSGLVSLGYDPALVFLPSNPVGSNPENNAAQFIGAWAPADGNFSTTYEALGNQSNTTCHAKVSSQHVADAYTASYSTQISAEAGGFRINCTGSTSNSGTAYMALDLRNGARAKVFNTTVLSSSGTYTESSPGFEPVFGMASLNAGPLGIDDGFLDNGILSNTLAFMTRSEGVRSSGSTFRDNRATSYSTRYVSTDSLWQIKYFDASTLIKSTSGGLNSTGWEFALSTQPSADVYGMGWAISDEGAAPTVDTIFLGSTPITPDALAGIVEVRLGATKFWPSP